MGCGFCNSELPDVPANLARLRTQHTQCTHQCTYLSSPRSWESDPSQPPVFLPLPDERTFFAGPLEDLEAAFLAGAALAFPKSAVTFMMSIV